MSKIIVHVNQHVIKHNVKHGTKLPTLTIKQPGGIVYAHEVSGSGAIVDINAHGRQPLSCGARVWMEFDSKSFQIVGPSCGFPEIQAAMEYA